MPYICTVCNTIGMRSVVYHLSRFLVTYSESSAICNTQCLLPTVQNISCDTQCLLSIVQNISFDLEYLLSAVQNICCNTKYLLNPQTFSLRIKNIIYLQYKISVICSTKYLTSLSVIVLFVIDSKISTIHKKYKIFCPNL